MKRFFQIKLFCLLLLLSGLLFNHSWQEAIAQSTNLTVNGENLAADENGLLSANLLANDLGNNIYLKRILPPQYGTLITWAADGSIEYQSATVTHKKDVIVYEVGDENGQTQRATAVIDVNIPTALTATLLIDCSQHDITAFALCTVDVEGGTYPYIVEGSWNGFLSESDSFSFDIADGYPVNLTIIDANGQEVLFEYPNQAQMCHSSPPIDE